MKTLNLLSVVIISAALNLSSYGQTNDQSSIKTAAARTETFKVFGNCELCKARIEQAVKDEGASSATWDTKTRMLTVTYDPSKTNKDKLSKKLASVGHDTEKYKAPDDVYDKLPACCHYDRAK
jgi:mercuric ion binding protein